MDETTISSSSSAKKPTGGDEIASPPDLAPVEQQVYDLIDHYRSQPLNPLFFDIFIELESQEDFWFGLKYTVHALRARSWNLDDHEISISQKALIALHSHEELAGAANVYLGEILGLGNADISNRWIVEGIRARTSAFSSLTFLNLLTLVPR